MEATNSLIHATIEAGASMLSSVIMTHFQDVRTVLLDVFGVHMLAVPLVCHEI